MKNALALTLAAAATLLASPGRADPPEESLYFEAYVFEAAAAPGALAWIKAHAMVKVGADATTSFPIKDRGLFTIKYTVRPGVDGAALVIVTGLLDGRIVAAGTVTVAHDARATVDLQGGSYTWHITGERMTKELLERRKG
jgi:hypothetical protein